MRCKTDDRGLCVKKPKQKVVYLTRRAPLEDYIDVVRDRLPFTNSTGTFHGKPITPLDAVRLRAYGDTATALALLMDEPDYVIFTDQGRPIAWHSTTRGIDSRAIPPNPERWEWVIPDNKDNRYYRAHYRIAESVVNTLNKELDNG
jgi:hypothetical protein